MDVLPLDARVCEWSESGYEADMKSSAFLSKVVKLRTILAETPLGGGGIDVAGGTRFQDSRSALWLQSIN
jgi:hypothetical protein